MKALSWLKNFVYLLLIVGILWLQNKAFVAVQSEFTETGKVNYWLYTPYILLPILAGIIIGFDHLLSEISKEGKWKINLSKLIFIIPSIFPSSLYFLAQANNETINTKIIVPVMKFFGNTQTFILVLQVVLGYSLITLLYKSKIVKVVAADGTDEITAEGVVADSMDEITTSSDVTEEAFDITDEMAEETVNVTDGEVYEETSKVEDIVVEDVPSTDADDK